MKQVLGKKYDFDRVPPNFTHWSYMTVISYKAAWNEWAAAKPGSSKEEKAEIKLSRFYEPWFLG